MKHVLMLVGVFMFSMTACKKDKIDGIPSDFPRTDVPTQLQGNWMYGNFSTTEYWSQNPSTYLGNGFEVAIAFKFFPNGTYEQYFTSSSVTLGVRTYHQSFSKGTVEVDQNNSTFITHCSKAHYKRTVNNKPVEDRDLSKFELSAPSTYKFNTITENGNNVLLLTLQGSLNPLKFLKKF